MKKQELTHRAGVLRQYEVYSYQVSYFLLENEGLAKEAATMALAELLRDDDFFHHPPVLQQQMTKRACMKHSLRTKADSLQQIVS